MANIIMIDIIWLCEVESVRYGQKSNHACPTATYLYLIDPLSPLSLTDFFNCFHALKRKGTDIAH